MYVYKYTRVEIISSEVKVTITIEQCLFIFFFMQSHTYNCKVPVTSVTSSQHENPWLI